MDTQNSKDVFIAKATEGTVIGKNELPSGTELEDDVFDKTVEIKIRERKRE